MFSILIVSAPQTREWLPRYEQLGRSGERLMTSSVTRVSPQADPPGYMKPAYAQWCSMALTPNQHQKAGGYKSMKWFSHDQAYVWSYNSGLVDIRKVLKRNSLRMLGHAIRRGMTSHLEKSDILRHLGGVHQVEKKRHGLRMWRKIWRRLEL